MRAQRAASGLIVGESAATRSLLDLVARVAPTPAPVLITGESGTGKDVVARALHVSGPRAAGPFVPINCAAVPEGLFEAELFGYARGAFTGAGPARAGVFEAAHEGTLFLDEIGELPLPVQPKLLRVLETGEVRRVGSTEPRHVNVRVVTATNRCLEEEVAAGRFRRDLYYRVSVCTLHLLALRDRPEDVPPLAHHHLARLALRDGIAPPPLTREALERLIAYPWPGNVRELVNVLERALLLAAPGGPIGSEHLSLPDAPPSIKPYRVARAEFDAAYFARVLQLSAGNVSRAARLAGKTRKEIYLALRKLRLDPASFRVGKKASGSR